MIIRQIKNTTTRSLFVVTNESGDVTPDTDRDAAMERMADQYGGNRLSVAILRITIPLCSEPVFELDLPDPEVIGASVPQGDE